MRLSMVWFSRNYIKISVQTGLRDVNDQNRSKNNVQCDSGISRDSRPGLGDLSVCFCF